MRPIVAARNLPFPHAHAHAHAHTPPSLPSHTRPECLPIPYSWPFRPPQPSIFPPCLLSLLPVTASSPQRPHLHLGPLGLGRRAVRRAAWCVYSAETAATTRHVDVLGLRGLVSCGTVDAWSGGRRLRRRRRGGGQTSFSAPVPCSCTLHYPPYHTLRPLCGALSGTISRCRRGGPIVEGGQRKARCRPGFGGKCDRARRMTGGTVGTEARWKGLSAMFRYGRW